MSIDLGPDVVTLRGAREFAERGGQLLTAAREEFVCAAIDLNTWALRKPTVLADGSMKAGLVVRKLYNPGALADPEAVRHLLMVAGHGAQVRISGATLPHETIIIDRRVAVIASNGSGDDREFTVVRTPAVVAGVHALFDVSWAGAKPLEQYRRKPELPAQGKEILELLADGHTDESAARRLGLSVRTYRRRVAELMTILGAESRFQAGTQARALGLL